MTCDTQLPAEVTVMRHDGDCIVTRLDDPVGGSQLRIDKADPKVLIAGQLLHDITRGQVDPQFVSFNGQVLRIVGLNRTVVYRITGYDAERDVYYAEWPD